MQTDALAAGRRNAVLAVIAAAVVLVVAGVSSLNIALPSIGADTGATQSELQWMVDAYALGLAALLLPFGALGDRFGRKWFFVAGLVIVAVGSLAGSLVDTPGALIATRAIGGIGAALVFPATLSTITASFPPELRGRGVAVWTASAAAGGTLGVLVGAIVLEVASWEWIFVGAAVLAAVLAVVGAVTLPNTLDPSHANLDPVGSVLSVVGVGGLVLGIIEGPVRGWTDGLTLTGLVVGGLGVLAFVAWELRTPRPILDVRLFGHRGFGTGSASVFLQFFAAFGFFFLSAQFFALVLGYDPLPTALALLPSAFLIPPLAAAAPSLVARFGRGRVGGLGLGLAAVGFLLFLIVDADASYWLVLPGLLVFGAGFGLAGPPATEAIVEALPAAKQGVASAVNDTAREIGGALGIAVIGAAFNAAYRGEIGDATANLPADAAAAVKDAPGAAFEIARGLGPAGADLVDAARDAMVAGWRLAVVIAAAVLVLGAVFVSLRLRGADDDVLDFDDTSREEDRWPTTTSG